MIKYYLAAAVGILLLIWPVELAILYSRINSYKKFWDKQNLVPDQPNQLLYVALGDSTAQGIGASKPIYSYPYLIKNYLQNQIGRPVKLVNLSVSGAKVNDVTKDQLPKLLGLKPDYVTIEIGANDMKSYSQQTFKEQFTELLKGLPAGSYVSEVPAFTGRSKGLDKNVIEANKQIASLLALTNMHKVDLYEATMKNKGIGYFAADYFHPNNRAYKTWAKAFTDTISGHRK